MSKAPPSFDFYYNDWLGGVQDLGPEDERHYLRLLIYQWQNGWIPRSKVGCMNVCGITDLGFWNAVWERLKHKFELFDDDENGAFWANKRMFLDRKDVIPRYQRRAQVARENGLRGGRKRKKPRRNPVGSKKKPRSEGGRGKVEDSNNKKKTVSDYDDTFQTFWSEYPRRRRRSKRAAYDAWCKALEKTDAETLISSAKEFAQSDEGRSEFCPAPAPWLNQERWLDDRAAWKRKTEKEQILLGDYDD